MDMPRTTVPTDDSPIQRWALCCGHHRFGSTPTGKHALLQHMLIHPTATYSSLTNRKALSRGQNINFWGNTGFTLNSRVRRCSVRGLDPLRK